MLLRLGGRRRGKLSRLQASGKLGVSTGSERKALALNRCGLARTLLAASHAVVASLVVLSFSGKFPVRKFPI